MNRSARSLRRGEALSGYAMIAPLMIGLFVFYVFAFGQNIWDSFTNKSSFGIPQFVGLSNYRKLFAAPYFYQSLWNTLAYVAICVPFVVAISVGLATLLNTGVRGTGTGAAAAFGRIASMLAPLSVPFLARAGGNPMIFGVFAASFGVAALASLALPEKRAQSLEE